MVQVLKGSEQLVTEPLFKPLRSFTPICT